MNLSQIVPAVVAACLAISAVASAQAQPAQPSPRSWIDPETGHRIVRLTDDAGGSTLYFHDNSYSPEGDKLMFNTPGGIAVVDVAKIGQDNPVVVVAPGGRGGQFARRTREIYYTGGGGARRGGGGDAAPASQPAAAEGQARGGRRGGGGGGGGGPLMAVNVDTKATRQIANARGLINADETLSAVSIQQEEPSGNTPKPAARQARPQLERMFPGKKMEELTPDQQYAVTKEDGLANRALNPPSKAFVFTDLKTGQSKTLGYQWGDINHMQWNPVDPNLMLYCHEGTWHEVDRTWVIRSDGTGNKLVHKRTMDMEINGHEWWSFDGKTVWFDLQTPRSQVFWIAGVNLETGKEVKYHIDRDAWSVHFNSSRDNTLFCGDGGDPTQVAFSPDGMWMNLFKVVPGDKVEREKLTSMKKHNYVTGRGGVEPNASITPDNKWVIFTGQFDGGTRHVYAVEIAKAGNQ
jgi:oligogalacturonide lyase